MQALQKPAGLERGLGSRHYPAKQAVADRIAVISRTRRVAAYLHAEIGADPATGKPTGKLIVDALAGIRLIRGTGQSPPTIPQPTDLRLHLLDLLDIDPRDLR